MTENSSKSREPFERDRFRSEKRRQEEIKRKIYEENEKRTEKTEIQEEIEIEKEKKQEYNRKKEEAKKKEKLEELTLKEKEITEHQKHLENDLITLVSGQMLRTPGSNIDYDEIKKMAKGNIRDADEAAHESLANDGLEKAQKVIEGYVKTGEYSLRDVKELEKDISKGTIAEAYVNIAKDAERCDLKWLEKIDDALDFSHPGYERKFDELRETDKAAEKVLDRLDYEFGRERE